MVDLQKLIETVREQGCVRQIFNEAGYERRRRYTVTEKVRRKNTKRRANIPRAELERLYLVEIKTTIAIGEIFNCNAGTVWLYLKQYKIPIRSRSEINALQPMPFPGLTKENLLQWFIEDRKTAEQIARINGCKEITVRKKLLKCGIKRNQLRNSPAV